MNEVMNDLKAFITEKLKATLKAECTTVLNNFVTKINDPANKPCPDDTVAGCQATVKSGSVATFDEGVTTRLDDPP